MAQFRAIQWIQTWLGTYIDRYIDFFFFKSVLLAKKPPLFVFTANHSEAHKLFLKHQITAAN